MIKKSIHSIRDLMDVLDTCIWENEYVEVFSLLNDIEKEYVYEQIENEISTDIDKEDLKDWQKAFLQFYIISR